MSERNVREDIYAAALDCFERDGVRRTTMEAVARRAGVSRPTVYYYFPDKSALVLEVIAREARAIHATIREQLGPRAGGLDTVVDTLLLSIEGARTSRYVALLTQPDAAKLTARLVEADLIMGLRRELWAPILEAARDRGELRDDLSIDEVLRWISFVEFSVITNAGYFGLVDDDQIRAYLDTFLLPSLASPVAAEPRRPARRGGPPPDRR